MNERVNGTVNDIKWEILYDPKSVDAAQWQKAHLFSSDMVLDTLYLVHVQTVRIIVYIIISEALVCFKIKFKNKL